MRRTHSHFTLSLVLAMPLLLAVGCGRPVMGPTLSEGEVPLLLLSNVSTTLTSTIVVEVNAPDIPSPLVFNIEITNGVASGTIDIPIGTGRTITIRAIDNNGIVTHRGVITVDVVAGVNPTVDISLESSTGQQPLIASFGTLGVVVEPAAAIVDVGGTVQLTATVRNANGDILSVPVRWATLTPAVAPVSTGGLATGVIKGTVPIVATFGGVGGSSVIIVGAVVDQVIVEPDQVTLLAGETVQLSATVLDAEGNILPVSVTWSTSDPAVATVDAGGLVTAVSTGTADIVATSGSVEGSSAINVEAVIDQIIVEPAQATLVLLGDETVQLSATVLDTDLNPLPVSVTWSTSDQAVATVDAGGLVTAVSEGTADVTASYGGVESSAAITVEAMPPTPPFVYVTNYDSHTVSVIDVYHRVVATIELREASNPRGIAITPDGAYAYVGEYSLDDVVVIDIANNTVVATIPVGDQPTGVAITPDGFHVYVCNFASSNVSVISTAINEVVATVSVNLKPLGLAITPDGAYAYVANWAGGMVSVIETDTNTMDTTILTTGSMPYDVAFTPDGALAFVPCFGGFGSVFVINTITRMTVRRIDIGKGPIGVAITPAFTPAGAFAYVTKHMEDEVSVINTNTWYEVATIPVGVKPYGIAFTHDGAYVYVANQSSDNVSVIDTAINEVVATIDVGFHPHGIAITP